MKSTKQLKKDWFLHDSLNKLRMDYALERAKERLRKNGFDYSVL